MLPAGAHADQILVSAAASLTNALQDIGNAFTRADPQTAVRFNFGSSGQLQQQIEQGAPVDVFASASPKEMDALQKEGHILAGTRVDFAGNRLVLIAPRSSRLKGWNDLRRTGVQRVALSNPAFVPSGRYAQQTLTKRGLWSIVQPKAVFGNNVRQTLAYVANGDADAGVVFATDAAIDRQHVRVVAEAIPGKDHVPIVYPAAVVTDAPNRTAARKFVRFLQGATAQGILARYGFIPVHPIHSLPVHRRR